MFDDIQLNVPLLRRRVPNLTVAAKAVGLRPATVSNLCNGKIPLSRAEVRTLVALASLAGCTLDELVLRGRAAGMIETGIKLLDLFAPLVRGGTLGLVARQGAGQMVVLQELLHRLRERGFATFVWTVGEPHEYVKDLLIEADGTGSELDEVTRAITTLRAERDVVVATDRSAILSGEFMTLRERLAEPGARPVTFALVDTKGEAPDEEAPFGPLETLWQFDSTMAARGIFPSVDPVISTSTLMEGAHLEATHLMIQQRARKLLRRYRELRSLAVIRGEENLPAAEVETFRRGARLEAYLTQPFYVAVPYTKIHGEWVALAETLEDVRRILDGAADELDPRALTNRGRAPWSNDH